MKRIEDSLRDLWVNLDNIKCMKIQVIVVPKEEKKKGAEKIFEEIVVENFPNLGKEIVKSNKHRVPYRINPRRNTSRHMVIKLTEIKQKEKILQAAKERQQITFKGKPIRLTEDLSAETPQTRILQVRREWQDMVKVLLLSRFSHVRLCATP